MRAWLDTQLTGPPEIVAEAIDGLVQLDASDALAKVKSMASHESEWVRSAVVRFIAALDPEESWPILAAAASDPHPRVCENVADELAAIDTPAAKSLRAHLANYGDPNVRDAATT